MAYIPIPNPPLYHLVIPPSVDQTYDLSKYPPSEDPNAPHGTLIPPEAKEVLIYFFVSVRDSTMSSATQRGFYEFTTYDEAASYTQYMNVIFTKNDYVMNSENIWLPIGEVKALNVKLNTFVWPTALQLKKPAATYTTLKEFKEHIASDVKNDIYAEFFVIGYR